MRFVLMTLAVTWLVCDPARAEGPKLPLEVIYAGKSGTDRSRDFRDFLRGRVAAVGTAEIATFRDRDADGYDIVILDGDPADVDRSFEKDASAGLGWPNPSPGYSRPTVLIGAMGGQVAKRHKLKFAWLCNCLDNVAHVLSPEYEIFQGPLGADLKVADLPTPPRYRNWPGGATLGASIPSWTVQRTAWMGQPIEPTTRTGLVLDPYGFEDSPDCEAIAAGLNWKCWDALAIARQANFLFWGFASPPSDMTSAGQATFLNGLAYIRKVDGQRPLVRRTHYHRTTWLKYASTHAFIDDEPTYATMMPGHLRRRLGTDYDAYPVYYRANLEYLHPTGESYVVDADEDAKSLGLSNRRVESLDAWIGMLEADDRPDLARRLLIRYTSESFDDALAWRAWFNQYRGRLFFSDTGGFQFRVANDGLPRPLPADTKPLDPDPHHPVAADMVLAPDRLQAGAEFALTVRVCLAPTWHLGAVADKQGPGGAATLDLDLPAGIEPVGPWEIPPAEVRDGQAMHSGSFTFRRRLRVRPDPGLTTVTIDCDLRFQACDPIRCLPPTTWRLTAAAPIAPEATRHP